MIVSCAEEIASGVLHRPHTGCRSCSIFSRGTRLFAPQLEQRISSMSVMSVPFMTEEFIVPHEREPNGGPEVVAEAKRRLEAGDDMTMATFGQDVPEVKRPLD